MVFATGDKARSTSEAVVDTDPDFFASIIASYQQQSNIARRIVPKRKAAYEKALGHPMSSILEIGCGVGAYATAYGEVGVTYRAIEIDADIAKHARENTHADIEVGDFMTIDDDRTYDVIFASQVFEHIATPHKFLKKTMSALTPNGILHLDVPNHGSLTSQVRKLVGKRDFGFIQPPHHMYAYTSYSLKRVLEMNDFTKITIKQYRNDDAVWGQLFHETDVKSKVLYAAAGALGMGSLLTAIAQ